MPEHITFLQKFLILWNNDPYVQGAKFFALFATVILFFWTRIFGHPYGEYSTMSARYPRVGAEPATESKALRLNHDIPKTSSIREWIRIALPSILLIGSFIYSIPKTKFFYDLNSKLTYNSIQFHQAQHDFLIIACWIWAVIWIIWICSRR